MFLMFGWNRGFRSETSKVAIRPAALLLDFESRPLGHSRFVEAAALLALWGCLDDLFVELTVAGHRQRLLSAEEIRWQLKASIGMLVRHLLVQPVDVRIEHLVQLAGDHTVGLVEQHGNVIAGLRIADRLPLRLAEER